MTYTEEEAEKLYCPQDRILTCVASKCMAWRWAQKPNPDWKPRDMMTIGMDTRSGEPMYIDDTTRGYCGLGGRS